MPKSDQTQITSDHTCTRLALWLWGCPSSVRYKRKLPSAFPQRHCGPNRGIRAASPLRDSYILWDQPPLDPSPYPTPHWKRKRKREAFLTSLGPNAGQIHTKHIWIKQFPIFLAQPEPFWRLSGSPPLVRSSFCQKLSFVYGNKQTSSNLAQEPSQN